MTGFRAQIHQAHTEQTERHKIAVDIFCNTDLAGEYYAGRVWVDTEADANALISTLEVRIAPWGDEGPPVVVPSAWDQA